MEVVDIYWNMITIKNFRINLNLIILFTLIRLTNYEISLKFK